MNRLTDVVKNLIIINVIVFIAQQTLSNVVDIEMGYSHFPMSDDFQPFQLITSMFMHADFQHLLFNMMSLFFLGPIVEQILGAKRFLILYIIAGLVGTALHIGFNYYEYFKYADIVGSEGIAQIIAEGRSILESRKNWTDPAWANLNHIINVRSLGASGAVYGVVIAFVTMLPKEKLMVFPLPIPVPAYIIGVLMVGIGVVSGVGQLQPGIAHFAHLGGALIGFLMIHYWKMANIR